MRNGFFIFPLAALFNSFSMTGLLLIFGLAEHWETAADIGLVQGATLALFYAFSANARNLILAANGEAAERRLLQVRLFLTLPLAAAAWGLSVALGGVSAVLATVLIMRRVAEWFGEIGLAHHERLNQLDFAQHALIFEAITLALCIILPLIFGFDLAVSAIPWMVAPLLAIRQAKLGQQREYLKSAVSLRALMPHFGATAIIGACVYVFRVSITLLAGKALAGELFTAFAIGGMIPTIFGQAFAPTLVRRFKTGGWPRSLLAFPALMLLAGAAISALAATDSNLLSYIGRPLSFWLAVGLSLAGGAIMVVAMVLRTRLIHHDDGREVFGPDLLANVLIATCVPFVFYLFGSQSLTALYLISACLSLGFLWGAGHGRGIPDHQRKTALFIIGVLLVLPVFFQIDGGLFNDPAVVFDSSRSLLILPIPLSAVAMFAGIALLGNYVTATRTLITLFLSAMLFVITSLAVTQGSPEAEGAKLILLAQFLLPMFGLILGEMYGSATSSAVFERAALWVLVLVLPAQLVATWLQESVLLQPKVFFFSIYQHLQYFPTIVAALIIMITPALWKQAGKIRLALLVLLPIAIMHLAASQSIRAIVGAGVGIVGLLIFYWKSISRRTIVSLIAVCIVCGGSYVLVVQNGYLLKLLVQGPVINTFTLGSKIGVTGSQADQSLPSNVQHRIDIWRFYSKGVVETPKAALLGHAAPPVRTQYPSAHNYWLDGLYNFGLIAMLPLIILAFETARLLWRVRARFFTDPMLFGGVLSTGYLLLGDNLLTVGMRQPYTGILTFFIWGMLIARLRIPFKSSI